MIDLLHYLAGFNGFDLLFWSVIGSGLIFSLYSEWKGIDMSKYQEFRCSFYNGCGHVFLFVILIELLGLLTGSGDSALTSDLPIVSALINLVVAIAHVLAFIGSLNIAERLNNSLKPTA